MSFAVARSLTNVASRLLRATQSTSRALSGCGTVLSVQGPRGFTRSMWHMSKTPAPVYASGGCSCSGIHTQGDRELLGFLEEEIKLEKQSEKSPGKLPRIKGFELTTEESNVTLTKKQENETITIQFNVNNTVDDDNPNMEYDETKPPEQQSEAQMVSKPPFIIQINKGGDLTLQLHCVFPSGEGGMVAEGEQHEFDVIEIHEVGFTKTEGEWDDSVYTVSGSIMDGNLYDMLLNMLEERGIDADFIDQMIDFSTTYEHKKYIGFLESLKGFATC